MKFLRYFSRRPPTANIARERLQIIVSHQQIASSGYNVNFIGLLQKEILDVVSRYVKVDQNQVSISLDKAGQDAMLEMNILLPSEAMSKNDT